jgi:hypothetical protein
LRILVARREPGVSEASEERQRAPV